MDEPLVDGTQEPTSPEPAPAATEPEATAPVVDPNSGGAAPTAGATPPAQQPAMVPSHRLREMTQQHQAAIEAAKQEAAQASQTAVAQERQQWEAKVRALMGLDQAQDPRKAALGKELLDLLPDKLRKIAETGVQNFAETDQFKAMQQQLQGYQQQQSDSWRRFGADRRTELNKLAKETFGKTPSDQQQHLIASTLRGVLQDNPQAQQAFFNDPKFISDFWKYYTTHNVTPQQKAEAAAVVQSAGSPAGPQSQPGGGNVQTTPAPNLSVDEKLGRHYNNLQKKYSGIYQGDE